VIVGKRELSFVLNYWEVHKIGGKIILFGKKRKSIYCLVIIGRFENSRIKLQCLMQLFPLSRPCQFQKKQTNKTVSWFDSSVSGSGRFFFSFVFCKFFVMVLIKVLLHCFVADKWHSMCEKTEVS